MTSRSISHEEWLRLLELRYPKGTNPWHDIYTDVAARGVAKTIKLRGEAPVAKLRGQLAMAAEAVDQFRATFGGIAPASEKRRWVNATRKNTGKLVQSLNVADTYLPELSASPFTSVDISALRQQLEGLRDRLDEITEEDLGKRPATMHADLLQFLVDRLTNVFLHYRSPFNVKRASDNAGVYGEFPDFIRESARPYLRVHHPSYREKGGRLERLDRQIQVAVVQMKRRMNETAQNC